MMSRLQCSAQTACAVQGCITYVAAQEDVEQVCQSILASGVEALGFDVEWHVTYRRAPAALTPIRQQNGAALGDKPHDSFLRLFGAETRTAPGPKKVHKIETHQERRCD